MDSIVELVKRNEQLLLENAEALNDEEVEQEDIDEYLKIQGATKEELSAFENQFQIRLPEDFKTVYSYKNGSGYMSLIWPQEGFYRGYRLLSLKEIIKLKSLFQNKNCKMTEFPNVIGEAMSAGLPVVAFDCMSGPSDMIANEKNGYLIELFNYESFKKHLQILMSDESLRLKLGLNAAESIQEFKIDEISKKYKKMILE